MFFNKKILLILLIIVFPSKTIAAITLGSAESTAIETFDCTWEYQHFEASGVNF